MPTFATPTLSGSLDGQPIPITASGSPGQLIHTAWNASDIQDKLTLTVNNTSTVSGGLTLEWGGVDLTTNVFTYGIDGVRGDGDFLLTWNKPLADGLEVRAYSTHAIATLSGHLITGEVIRVSRDEL